MEARDAAKHPLNARDGARTRGDPTANSAEVEKPCSRDEAFIVKVTVLSKAHAEIDLSHCEWPRPAPLNTTRPDAWPR